MFKKILFTVLITFNVSAFAEETEGSLRYYKPADHSSISHMEIRYDAAESLFNHLSLTNEYTNQHGEVIRKGKNLECVFFTKEPTPFHRCYLNIDESGKIDAGY